MEVKKIDPEGITFYLLCHKVIAYTTQGIYNFYRYYR